MGRRNVLVEGVSGAGKSSVARELRQRGFAVVDGDRELAYQGDPVTEVLRQASGSSGHSERVSR